MDRTEKPQIPASAAPFFQEYRLSSLDVTEHSALIIERILAYGSRAEVQWLLATYGRPAVRDWVERAGLQRLTWRRFHLWCLVFEIPLPEKPRRIWPH